MLKTNDLIVASCNITMSQIGLKPPTGGVDSLLIRKGSVGTVISTQGWGDKDDRPVKVEWQNGSGWAVREDWVNKMPTTAWQAGADWWWVDEYLFKTVGGRSLYELATVTKTQQSVQLTRFVGLHRINRYVDPDTLIELVAKLLLKKGVK